MPSIDDSMLELNGKEVYLACGFTDMRKSINGLAALVEGSFKHDLFSKSVFVFCNRNRDRVKLLYWDGDGFWLYFKRLETGRFKWPTLADEEKTMSLTSAELGYLLGSPKVIQKVLRNEVKIGAVI